MMHHDMIVIVIGLEYLMPIRYEYMDWVNTVWARVMSEVFGKSRVKDITDDFIEMNYGNLMYSNKYIDSMNMFTRLLRNAKVKNYTSKDIESASKIMKEMLNSAVFITPMLSEAIMSIQKRPGHAVMLMGNCCLRERDLLLSKFGPLCYNALFSCDVGSDAYNPDTMSDHLLKIYNGVTCGMHLFTTKQDLYDTVDIDCSEILHDIKDIQDNLAKYIITE